MYLNISKKMNEKLPGQIVQRLIFIMIICIIGIGVLLPILAEVIAGAGLTGYPSIILSYFSLVIACAIMIYVVIFATG